MLLVFRTILTSTTVLTLFAVGTGCAQLRLGDQSTERSPTEALSPQLSASAAGISIAPPSPATQTLTAPPEANIAPASAGAEKGDRAPEIVPSHAAYRIRPGDPLIIYLRGIMPRDEEFQLMVNERGNVVLPFIGEVGAAGRTSSELEREIQRAYIEQEIYRSVTVNVIVPAQSFFVQGEVRAPQRYPIIAGMTLMQAIAAAGGYTEFADRKRVMLTRAGVVRTINMREIERDPRLDITIESGDVIRVPRSIF